MRYQRALQFAAKGLIAVVCAFAVGMMVLTVVLPRLVGGGALTVLSGSMTPTYPVGSIVVVRPVAAGDVAAGDAITFASADSRSFTTHRVVAVEQDSEGEPLFTTQGDANPRPDDDQVTAGALRGRVWFHVPYVGHVREAAGSRTGLTVVAGLIGLSLLAEWLARRRGEGTHPAGEHAVIVPPRTNEEPFTFSASSAATNGTGAPDLQEEVEKSAYVEAASSEPDDLALDLILNMPHQETPTTIERQLLVATLGVGPYRRGRVLEVLPLYDGQVLHMTDGSLTFSVSAEPWRVDEVIGLLSSFEIRSMRRSEVLEIPRPSTAERGTTSTQSTPEPEQLRVGTDRVFLLATSMNGTDAGRAGEEVRLWTP